MQATASVKTVRISPRKVGIVLDLIRNQPVETAQAILRTLPKAAAEPLEKLLKSAVANAANNFEMNIDKCYVSACWVGAGMTMKRIRPQSKGRAARILKRTSNITLVVTERE